MEIKNFPVTEIKALPEEGEGVFEAIVAVFGNVDRGGDRIKKGAFKRTLEERGLPPIIWSHNWDIPPIGATQEAVENNEGLRIKGRLFVGAEDDHAIARQVYTAMKATDGNGQSPLREFSFGFETQGSSTVEEDGVEIRELTDLDLFEAGPTLVGMNPDTRLVAVKSAAKAIAEVIDNTTSEEEEQPHDTPDPNSAQADDEERARIARLTAARPIHLTEE